MTLSATDKLSQANAATVAHAVKLMLTDPENALERALSHAEQTVPVVYEHEQPRTYSEARRSRAAEPGRADRRAAWAQARAQAIEAEQQPKSTSIRAAFRAACRAALAAWKWERA